MHSSLGGSADTFFFYGLTSHIICRRSLTKDASCSFCLYLIYLRTDAGECICIYHDDTFYMDSGANDDKRSRKCRDGRKGWIRGRLTQSSSRGLADTVFFSGLSSHIMCR